tara:strand:+ start:102 stop:512 length:411 start_codon:yes stop_codon:yes gene_type:complete
MDCIFCKIAKNEEKSWTVYEDDFTKAFFDISVANEGHTLIIPKKHYENIYDIPEEELCRIISVAKKLALVYKKALNVSNVQIFHSSGKFAQQDVFHFHLHLVPRHEGDDIDLSYKSHPELRDNFDTILAKIKKYID